MRKIKVGLLGTLISNPNMGCSALTYSLILLLEKYAKKNNLQIEYRNFMGDRDKNKINLLVQELGLDSNQIVNYEPVYIKLDSMLNFLRTVNNYTRNKKKIEAFKECSFVIDLTQGDSFTDIYGKERFEFWTHSKIQVQKNNVPLILGPQTYGPFNCEKLRKKAIKVINDADLVITRDELSKEYIQKYTNKEVILGTDLAFVLPYITEKKKSDLIRVGLNVSGLLTQSKKDSSNVNFKITIDYDRYIRELIKYLLKSKKYEVHIIPHVGDGIDRYGSDEKGLIYHDDFVSPIEAKNCIAGMDIFIGARMHATIAALSSGVATIPTAYSRKFKGLFETIGYDCLVDLTTLTTEKALELTIDYINNYNKLISCGIDSMENVKKIYSYMEEVMFSRFDQIIKQRGD